MATTLGELNREQLGILGSAEERSRTCARAYAIGNEIPKAEQPIIEEAYCRGWFRGGLDNVRLIQEQQTISYSALNFGIGLSVGSVVTVALFMVFG